MKTLAVISLGCDKNRVDTEKMLGNLSRGSFSIVPENQAEIIIINTCAFVESARREAVDTILSCAEYKKDKCEKLIVTGCLPQKHRDELKAELPEVDAFLGVNDYGKTLEIIEELYSGGVSGKELHKDLPNNADVKPQADKNVRVLTTPGHYAYLKIADGCDNKCTFCTIPSIRGAYKSESIEALVAEATVLVDMGVKELILVAQDVTNYGMELYSRRRLVDLIRALSQTKAEWIRLMYCYPESIDDALINEIKTNPKVVKYLDMPLQHVDDKILRLMARRGTNQQIKDLFRRLKKEIPDLALRTTLMTGFPSEGDAEFDNLALFLREHKLTHAGFFAFSPEQGTPAAKLSGRVNKSISAARLRALAQIQKQNVLEFNQSQVGKTVKVLYEGIDFDKNLFFGRAYFSAPEIDTLVYFKSDTVVEVGEFYDVVITKVKGYDLVGKAAGVSV